MATIQWTSPPKFTLRTAALAAVSLFLALASGADASSDLDKDKPVVEFHKFRSELFAPAFRVRVFGDGTVEYQGIEKVKVEGTHRLSIPAESIEKLVEAFIGAGFDTFTPPTSLAPADAYISMTISIVHPRLSRSVTFSAGRNPGEYAQFLAALDSGVPTRELRCPYVVQLSGWTAVELCERADLLLRLAKQRRNEK